jgi:hypothetical protein
MPSYLRITPGLDCCEHLPLTLCDIFQKAGRMGYFQVGSSWLASTITVVSFCWHICLISESMGHHDSEIMDDGSID